jgi:hypothetical protein
VRIAEYDRPMRSDDEETSQTVAYMDELATADANDPAVEAATAAALDEAGIDASADPFRVACAIYWWLKRTIRYVPTPGTSPLVDQTLISPCAVLAMPEPIGDCPQFSMLAAAMLRCCCIPSMYVTIAAEPAAPELWSHVYNTVEIFPGQYMPFDSSNGPEPGAEYARPYKRRVWPHLSPGPCRTKEGAADMIRAARRNGAAGGMRNATLRSRMGDLYDDIGVDPSYTGTQLTSEGDIMTGPGVNLSDPALQIDSSSMPSTSGSGILTTLLNDATSIAAPLIRSATQQAPYYVTNAAGQSVLYNPNTGTYTNPSTIGSAINPTVIVIGVGLLAALAFMGSGRR